MYPSLWIIGLLVYLHSPWALVDAVVTFSPSLLNSRSLLTSATLIVAHPPSTTPSVKDTCGALSACKKRVLPYSKTLTIAVVGIFVACAIMAFLSVYVRRFCLRGGNLYVSYQSRIGPHRGNVALVKSLPVVTYDVLGDESKQTVKECAVCLNELQRGELLRVLPVCSHPFHKDCVDMWLFSHTTCPLCRGSVLKPKKGSLFSFA